MAEEPQEKTAEEGVEEPPPSKSKLSAKTLVLIGLPLILVQALLAYVVVSNFIEPKLPETKPKPEEKQAAETPTGQVEDLSTYITYPVDDVIVNPAESGGQRDLSVSVNIYVPMQFAEMIKDIDPEIRSLIIERISRKRMDELDDFKDQQILREELKDDLNTVVKRYFATKFPDMVIPRVVFSK
ncbi:MAG: flagellar basal body-associated FliL family protein, partial [Candidatus Glassbacteria bacterium]